MEQDTFDLDQVIAAELDEIAARRKAVGLPPPTRARPVEHADGLFGVAISGGGIRSSTFSLGVIQALERAGLLAQVDYLSTVSGGGYTGAMLSSLLREPGGHTFALRKDDGVTEPAALQHLRNGSNYLSSGSILETVRLPMLLLRGLLLNALAVAPVMILAVFLTEVLYEGGLWPDIAAMNEQGLSLQAAPIIWAAMPFFLIVFSFPLIAAFVLPRARWGRRNRIDLLMSASLLGGLLALVGVPALYLVQVAIETPMYGEFGLQHWFGSIEANSMWWQGSVLAALAANARIVLGAARDVGKRIARYLIYLVGALVPLVGFAVYLLLCVLQVDSPFLSAQYCPALNDMAGITDPDRGVSCRQGGDFNRDHVINELVAKGVSPSNFAVIHACADQQYWFAAPWAYDGRLDRWCGSSHDDWEAAGLVQIRPYRDKLELDGTQLHLFSEPTGATMVSDQVFLGVGLLLFIYVWLFFDCNATSLHSFYRDRLSRLYIFRVVRGRVVANDHVRLSQLGDRGAPYHLVNTALNLQANTVASQRGRQADFFLLSPRFCGSGQTGYCRTVDMERADRHLDLATAMAISGAAAAPNMGSMTRRSLVAVLTLFNVRLNYWLPHPNRVHARGGKRCGRAGPWYLLREALGRVDAEGAFVNLSDGGHIENLGIYELLRRRCPLIMAIDGEADPALTFGGLVTLLRFAEADLGIRIDLDIAPLRPDDGRCSREHIIIGQIHYGVDVGGHPIRGRLVYVKASWTGDEPLYLAEYRRQFPAFPHESTADQFFDEIQFEAYRALGYHVGELATSYLQRLPTPSLAPGAGI